MARSRAKLPDIVIALGQTSSNTIEGVAIDDALALVFAFLGGGDTTKTYTLYFSPDMKSSGTMLWYALNDGTANITLPNTSQTGCVYPWTGIGSIKVVASAAVANATTWNAIKIWET